MELSWSDSVENLMEVIDDLSKLSISDVLSENESLWEESLNSESMGEMRLSTLISSLSMATLLAEEKRS